MTNAAGVITGTAVDTVPFGVVVPPGGWPVGSPNGYGGSDSTFTQRIQQCRVDVTGVGRCLTDDDGGYAFTTIKPGPYPWRNHDNAWRPAHIHFSLLGRAFTQRLVTQMYFPDDPLFFQDPIFNSVPDPAARQRMVARYDHAATQPEWALGFAFDLVLRGRHATPFEPPAGGAA